MHSRTAMNCYRFNSNSSPSFFAAVAGRSCQAEREELRCFNWLDAAWSVWAAQLSGLVLMIFIGECVCVCVCGGKEGGWCMFKLEKESRKCFLDGCIFMPRSICIYSATVASIMIMMTDPGSAERDPIYTECVIFLRRGLTKERRGKKRSKTLLF